MNTQYAVGMRVFENYEEAYKYAQEVDMGIETVVNGKVVSYQEVA